MAKPNRGGKWREQGDAVSMRVSKSPVLTISHKEFLKEYTDQNESKFVTTISSETKEAIKPYMQGKSEEVLVSNYRLWHIWDSHPESAINIIYEMNNTIKVPDEIYEDRQRLIFIKNGPNNMHSLVVVSPKDPFLEEDDSLHVISGRTIGQKTYNKMKKKKNRYNLIYNR